MQSSITTTDNTSTLMKALDHVLQHDICSRHSYFQLKYFLIGKEPTIQSKMWQCLRELKTRRESLAAMDLEAEEVKDKIQLLDISIGKMEIEQERGLNSDPDSRYTLAYCELHKQEFDIKIRQAGRQKKAAEGHLQTLAEKKKWVEEECQFFLQTYLNLEKMEPLKHFDDIESQKAYWSERLAQKLNLKMLTHNQLDTELVETIVALPDDMPVKKQALNTLNARHAHMVQAMTESLKKLENRVEKVEKET